METLTHAINWFEIPVTDFARAKKFYTALYDFEMPEHVMGPNRMGFFQADTATVRRPAATATAAVAGARPASKSVLR